MGDMSEQGPLYLEPDRHIDTVVLMGHMGRDSVCKRIESWQRDLYEYSPDLNVVVLPTAEGGIGPNTELILENQHLFGPGTIQAEITGDGGANDLVNANLRAAVEYPHIGQTAHLFGDGGTMGDTARSFNTRRQLKKPSRVLEKGWLCAMNLLEIEIDSGGEKDSFSALGYKVDGEWTYRLSKLINGDDYRNSPWLCTPPTKKLRQVAAVLQARRDATPITISENGGEAQTLLDVLYVAGPRMAGLRTGIKELTEPGYHRIELRNKHWPYLALRIGQLLTRTITCGEPTTHETRVEFKSKAGLQYDGETRPIKAGDTVTVRPGPQIPVVTTFKKLRTNIPR